MHRRRDTLGPVASRYLDVVTRLIETDLGRPLGTGTTIVPAADRADSATAVVYDLLDRSAVWCDPALADRLQPLARPDLTVVDEFVDRCVELGGQLVGVGENCVLEATTVVPQVEVEGLRAVWLDRDDPTDVDLLAGLRHALSDDDADEAEFDLDDLDAVILGLVSDDSGTPTLVAQAGSRPWQQDDALADVGVAVHPAHRRRGLGAAVVAGFVRGRSGAGELLMYRYDVENAGSRSLASAVGFTIVHRVASMRFPDVAGDTG